MSQNVLVGYNFFNITSKIVVNLNAVISCAFIIIIISSWKLQAPLIRSTMNFVVKKTMICCIVALVNDSKSWKSKPTSQNLKSGYQKSLYFQSFSENNNPVWNSFAVYECNQLLYYSSPQFILIVFSTMVLVSVASILTYCW